MTQALLTSIHRCVVGSWPCANLSELHSETVSSSAACRYTRKQVDEWSPDLLIQENKAKQSAKILFFVIDGRTRAMASMLEVAELICGGKCVVLTIVDVPEDAVIAGEAVNGRLSWEALKKSVFITMMVRCC